MLHRFSISIALALLWCVCSYSQDRRVILITIDGLRAEMVTDMPSPFLQEMAGNGVFFRKVKGIAPTSTYPSHTTIITGKNAAGHGIFYNSPFTGNKDTVVSNWWADSIRTKTLWQAAKEAGLRTASLFWPVSTGCRYIDYNIPEFWSVEPVENQLEFLKGYCTPEGILDEIETYATGKLDHDNFWAGTINRDAKTAYMANYIINRYDPAFMSIHLITTDYSQHRDGLDSYWVRQTMASADNAVGLIMQNLKATGKDSSTVVIVCGDHGFSEYEHTIAPNVWLADAGLLSRVPGGEWKACFHRGGATMFLYLKDRDDSTTLKKIIDIIGALPESTREMFRIYGAEELRCLGADPKAVLAIEPVEGVASSPARSGKDVIQRHGGAHGYLSGIDPAACIIYGDLSLDHGADTIMQTDIARYIAAILGIQI